MGKNGKQFTEFEYRSIQLEYLPLGFICIDSTVCLVACIQSQNTQNKNRFILSQVHCCWMSIQSQKCEIFDWRQLLATKRSSMDSLLEISTQKQRRRANKRKRSKNTHDFEALEIKRYPKICVNVYQFYCVSSFIVLSIQNGRKQQRNREMGNKWTIATVFLCWNAHAVLNSYVVRYLFSFPLHPGIFWLSLHQF